MPRSDSRTKDASTAVQVAPLVDARALDRLFDYRVPAHLADDVRVGSLVVCHMRGRPILGCVVGDDPPTHGGALADIAAIVADVPPLDRSLLDLAHWMSRYYATPLAGCLRLILPPGVQGTLERHQDGRWTRRPLPAGRRQLIASDPVDSEAATQRHRDIVGVLGRLGRPVSAADLTRAAHTTLPTLRAMAERGLLTLTQGILEDDSPAVVSDSPEPVLTSEQSAVLDALALGEFSAHLLHGVTGSGKTEVYIRLIEKARSRGAASLILVPEIALTPQISDRLVSRLGQGVVVWHSAMSVGARGRADARIRRGEVDVVIGARSAVFAPFRDLALVVIDEEHDASYKQDASPRYDARQVAYRRARDAGALLVYGSATPRPESWHTLPRLSLARRADGAALPRIEVVDMRTQRPGPLSRPLTTALQTALGRGEKAIVLLNRRGLARQALCRSCGWIGRCSQCDVPLVIHQRPPTLRCHHCGFEAPVPALCPECGSSGVTRQGSGTQGLDEALTRELPGARLIRLDSDVIGQRGELERRLEAFRRPGPAVLFGTQMVAKGHDLPDVTVAGVIDADAALQQPDFRAEERTFSLIVQLAGRAGRRGEPATVYVQAWEPDSRVVRLGARHAVEEFLDGELLRRADHGYPPFGHLVRVSIEGEDRSAVDREAGSLKERLAEALPDADVLGPVRRHRLRGRWRRGLLIRAARAVDVAPTLRRLVDERSGATRDGPRFVIDVDPQET